MEALQLHLSQMLLHNPIDNLFENEQVLVQSPGMAQWLKVLLTEQHGVTGQIDYVLPSSFIWRLYQRFLTDVPEESSFNKDNMAWKLFNILPKCLELETFSLLKQYLEDNKHSEIRDTRLFSLCEKIADAFDQYLMYRPQWLESWEAGQDTLADVDITIAPWQPILWRKLVQHTEELGQNSYHRANLHQDLIAKLANPKIELPYKSIYIFGLSTIPNQQLAAFQALAQHLDVYLYLCNPSKHYWGDVVDEKTKAKITAKYALMPHSTENAADYYIIGNPLLASWGKLGREYLEQLVELDAQWTDIFVEQFDTSLLSQLQQEIFQLAFKGKALASDPTWFVSNEGKLPVKETTCHSSMHMASCHSALREVEVLHDHLLSLFAADPTLTPRDVIVMMPDSGKYSPYIEAVFGSAKQERYIPYAISDLGIEQEKPIVNSFLKLANISESRFYVSDILDLLQVDEIANKFEISHHDLQQVSYWLEQVNIRWGIDGEHKGQFKQPQIALNTWQQGLSRLMLGFAMQDETQQYRAIYPADQVEGMNVEILAKLIRFFDALQQAQQEMAQSDTLINKVAALKTLISCFYENASGECRDLLFITKALDKIALHYGNNDHLGEVSASLMVNVLKQSLMQKGVGQRFFMGQVNFCTLMPMRAVPFKIVCILGLNDGDYPRSVQPLGFDLLQYSRPQKGDRSRKLDDRYLFLEALLSARSHVYLSYIGNSCVDNSERIPSVLLSELTDYLARVFVYENEQGVCDNLIKQLTTQHFLQPFNPRYYEQGDYHSHNPIWLPKQSLTNLSGNNDEINVQFNKELELAQFINHLLTPQQSFYRNTIGVKLGDYSYNNQDDETFTVDGLTRYRYLQEIIEHDYVTEKPNIEALIARGDLPYGAGAEFALEQMISTATPLVNELKQYQLLGRSETNNEPVRVNVEIGELQVSGPLKPIALGKQFLYRPAKLLKEKDKIAGYLYHLIGSLCGEVNTTLYLGLTGYIEYQQLTQEDAKHHLTQWADLYLMLLKRPLPLFPRAGFAYIEKRDIQSAEAVFSGTPFAGVNEVSDPYIALDFITLSDVEDEFITLTETYLAPINAIVTEHNYAQS